MQECKTVKVPIHVGVNLSTYQCPKTHRQRRRTCLVLHMRVQLEF
jgi:hypothetical protein